MLGFPMLSDVLLDLEETQTEKLIMWEGPPSIIYLLLSIKKLEKIKEIRWG
jgi:hypothetical protein